MQVGNQAGLDQFMQGVGMMGESVYGQLLAGRQAVANMLSVNPQKLRQVQQQRRGFGGGVQTPITGSGVDPNMIDPRITTSAARGRAEGPSPITGDIDAGGGGSRVTEGGGGSGGRGSRVTGSGGGSGGGGNQGGGRGAPPAGRTPVGGTSGGMDFNRSAMLGGATNVIGMAAPVMMGVGNIAEGKTLEGVGNISGGAAALAATRGMNPLIRLGAAGLGAIGVGGLGAAGDRAIAEKTGQGSEDYNPEKQRYQTKQSLNTLVQGMNDIQKTALENDLLRMKAQEPVINRMLDKQLVRQQAMNASLTNSYAMLGTLSTAGKLAQQGQMEAGANFRAAIQSNPFGNSVVASPSISF